MKHIYIFILLYIKATFFSELNAQNAGQNLKDVLNEFGTDPVMKHGSWGFVLKNVNTGEIIAEQNAQTALTPASTLKVLTTTVAYEVLGENYRYKTILEYSGKISNDTLYGNVYVSGSGDPTLDSYIFKKKKDESVLDRWALKLNEQHIKILKGQVVAIVDCFDDQITPPNWLWTDMGNYYGAGPSGLNFMDNKFTVYFDAGPKVGSLVQLKNVYPEIKGLDLVNEVRTAPAGTGDKAFIFGEEFNNRRVIRGTIPVNKDSFDVEGAMPDPALFCVQSLQQKLNNQTKGFMGLAVTTRMFRYSGVKLDIPEKMIAIDTVFSPRLSDIIYYTNLKSNNLYAESILKTMAFSKKGKGTTIDGIEIVKDQIKKYASITSLAMYDGSGLSPMNRIAPALQCEVMMHAAKQKYFNALLSSFPVAGKSGSLSNICQGTAAEGKIYAKSGYIEGVRAYTGYVKNSKGEWMAFSFIVNNYNCSPFEIKKKIEKVFITMAQI